jgi:hypothetical protein
MTQVPIMLGPPAVHCALVVHSPPPIAVQPPSPPASDVVVVMVIPLLDVPVVLDVVPLFVPPLPPVPVAVVPRFDELHAENAAKRSVHPASKIRD